MYGLHINLLLVKGMMCKDQIQKLFANNTRDSVVISFADGFLRLL